MKIETRLTDLANMAPEGMELWYERAHESAREFSSITGIDLVDVAAALAITSPRLQVERNARLAAGLLVGGDITGLMRQRVKAWDHYVKTGVVAQSGLKVKNFHQNLLGNVSLVTVDVWVSRAFGTSYEGVNSPAKDDNVYRRMAGTITRLANRYGVSPAGFQACVWYGIRAESGIVDAEGWLDIAKYIPEGVVC